MTYAGRVEKYNYRDILQQRKTMYPDRVPTLVLI